MHVPVGRPVVAHAQGRRRDPQLLGAEPARQEGPDSRAARRRCSFRADRAGVYRGQCAEFCGFQHAMMAFERRSPSRPTQFDAWAARAARSRAASRPTRRSRRGQRGVPAAARASMCHAIAGHAARAARTAPDLTHVASRADARRRHAAEHAGEPRRAGSPTRSASSRASTCRRRRCRRDDLRRAASPTWRALQVTRRALPPAPRERVPPTPTTIARARARPGAIRRGFVGWLAAINHKAIGLRFIVTAFVFFVARRPARGG